MLTARRCVCSRQDLAYERARDSKQFAGLMSLEQIKAKKAKIESGEEFEDAVAKAARQKRADAEALRREALVSREMFRNWDISPAPNSSVALPRCL